MSDEPPSDTADAIRAFYETPVEIDVLDEFTTDYQDVFYYRRRFPECNYFPGWERVLRLDDQRQVWESAVREYHRGLVNVPLSFFEDPSEKDVLLVGGGDWIAVNYLSQFGADITHVDLDEEFVEYAKTNEFLAEHHEHAYEYDGVTTHVEDGFDYVTRTDETFDLVLLDIPGISYEALLPLFSVEFYEGVRESLREEGMAVIWHDPPEVFEDHYAVYMQTLREAGFSHKHVYKSHRSRDAAGLPRIYNGFYLLTTGWTPTQRQPRLEHTMFLFGRQSFNEWQSIPETGVDPNSVDEPNRDVMTPPSSIAQGED